MDHGQVLRRIRLPDTSYKIYVFLLSYFLFMLKWNESYSVAQQNKVARIGMTLKSLIEVRKVLIWHWVCANRGSRFWTKWVGKDHLCWQISNVTPPVARFHPCQHRCVHSCPMKTAPEHKWVSSGLCPTQLAMRYASKLR